MTTLNDFSVVDGNQYVLAAYYNLLLGSILRKEFSNAVVMNADLELTDGDTAIQRLNCNGANRVVKVPPGANGNHPFLVINTTSVGAWTLTVKSNDAVTTHQVLDPGKVAFVVPDGNGGYVVLTADDDHAQYHTDARGDARYPRKYAGKTAAPTVNDDSGDGHEVGDRWLDETNDKEYVALDVTLGAAVWIETAGTGGWTAVANTWTRTGNHTFTVAGNVTATYRKGTKVRYMDGGAFEYGVVASSSYAAPNTTVTLITNTDYAMAAATITDRYISHIENPEGFPTEFAFTPTGLVTIGDGTQVGKWSVRGGHIHMHGHVVYGSTTSFLSSDMTLPVNPAGSYLAGTSRPTLGYGSALDLGVGLYLLSHVFVGPSSARFQYIATGGAYATISGITAGAPFTFGLADEITFNMDYEF